MELAAGYSGTRVKVEGNLTWQRVLASQNYSIIGNSVYNIPDFQANLTAAWEIISGLKVNAHGLFLSKQKSLYALPEFPEQVIDIPARMIVDMGASYAFWKMEVGINVYNIINTTYLQGGSSVAPMQQAGRWLLGHVSIKF